MRTERRWMRGMIEEAAALEVVLPWARGTRKARRPELPEKQQRPTRRLATRPLPAEQRPRLTAH